MARKRFSAERPIKGETFTVRHLWMHSVKIRNRVKSNKVKWRVTWIPIVFASMERQYPVLKIVPATHYRKQFPAGRASWNWKIVRKKIVKGKKNTWNLKDGDDCNSQFGRMARGNCLWDRSIGDLVKRETFRWTGFRLECLVKLLYQCITTAVLTKRVPV